MNACKKVALKTINKIGTADHLLFHRKNGFKYLVNINLPRVAFISSGIHRNSKFDENENRFRKKIPSTAILALAGLIGMRDFFPLKKESCKIE